MALGGKVERSAENWNVGIEDTVFQKTRRWMEPHFDRLPMYVFHEDQVTRHPEGCELLGSTEKCRIASFAKGDHIFTTQSHPEITDPFFRCVLDAMHDTFDEQARQQILTSIEREQRGDVFASWATRFFLGERRHD